MPLYHLLAVKKQTDIVSGSVQLERVKSRSRYHELDKKVTQSNGKNRELGVEVGGLKSELRLKSSELSQVRVATGRAERTAIRVTQDERNHNLVGTEKTALVATKAACIAAFMAGNAQIGGDDAAEQSAAAINGGDQLVDLVFAARANFGSEQVPDLRRHAGSVNRFHPKITVASTGTISDPLYHAPSRVPVALGGTVTWGALSIWVTATAYSIGDVRTNAAQSGGLGGNVYVCTAAGTSGGADTGPTGKGLAIVDNGATWKFVGSGILGTLMTATAGLVAGDAIRKDDDGIWFESTAVEEDLVAVFKNPHGHTVGTGASASSLGDLPRFGDDGTMRLRSTLAATAADGDNVALTVDISTQTAPIDLSGIEAGTLNIPIGA